MGHPNTCGSARYLNEFLKLKCAPDMLLHKLFPNAKEVSESFGAYNAIRNNQDRIARFDDPTVTLVCVGDGNTPRTAATFAFRSSWTCISVDPRLKCSPNIRRLTCLPCKVEDMPLLAHTSRVVLVAVHSHADLSVALNRVAMTAGRVLGVVAIPCCVPQELAAPPAVQYDDPGILSPKRTVKVWYHGQA